MSASDTAVAADDWKPRCLTPELLGLLVVLAGCAAAKPLMAVNVPVTDLRTQPGTTASPSIHDPLEETQLLYGERVRVLKTKDGWAQVEAIEQPEFSHTKRWQGYPGWVPTSTLILPDSFWTPTVVVTDKWATTWHDAFSRIPSPWRFALGTRLRAVDMGGQLWKVELLDGTTVWMPRLSARPLEELQALSPAEKRAAIVRAAALLIGDAYYWGGRSPASPTKSEGVTGIDCSGLVNLAYRSVAVDIPRDAHEQFLRAKSVNTLQPADLIFLSERGNPQRIVHVMLYAGNGELIEGPGTGQMVRRISVRQRLGHPLELIASGTVVEGQTVYLGTYF